MARESLAEPSPAGANLAHCESGAESYSQAIAQASHYFAWIIETFAGFLRPPILEVGVGHGSYSDYLAPRGAYLGIDADPGLVAEARKRWPNRHFEVADITSPGAMGRLGAGRFNSVICLNVLEHIGQDQEAVNNLMGLIAAKGALLILVPALPALYNDLDRLAGHLRRYRKEDVRKLLAHAGLEIARASYFNPLGGLGWWANRLVRYQSLNDAAVNAQISLFDRWIVPLSRALDPLTRKAFGQSVIAVGLKR